MEEKLPESYTEAITELEQIVGLMQSDKVSIDNLSRYTSRALLLLNFCKQRLTTTDAELRKILAALEA